MKFRFITFILAAYFLFAPCASALAAPAAEAEMINNKTTVSGSGYKTFSFLFDADLLSPRTSSGNATVSLTCQEPIGYLNLIFNTEYPDYRIENPETGEQATISGGLLHQCIDISTYFQTLPTALTLHFESGSVALNELTIYSPGQLPDEVQQWKPPADGKADLLLLCAHGDDEQLFFAGLLPLYAAEKGAEVQVAYLTDHRNLTGKRVHEMLNGLWAVGCRTYPVFGSFPDFRIDDLERTYQKYERMGYGRDQLLEFVVTQLRRFRPQVVVGHDLSGEYGHGMHMVYADTLTQALTVCADSKVYPELAEQYGVWDVPKTYLHLYQEQPIVIDYDSPLPSFGGMTAFQVTQTRGFPCHKSQQYTWFTRWLYGKNNQITAASQISTYSPCQFGLYRSIVGEDHLKNDFLENITTYAEQDRLELERLEQERLEQERLEQERLEQERLEQERLEQERLEQERLAKELLEQKQLEEERLKQERQLSDRLNFLICILVLLVLAAIAVLLLIRHRKTSRRRTGKRF